MVFPLFQIMDRVVITKPGEIPPLLGQELPESDEDQAKRRSGEVCIQFQPENIYSFSFHSSFVDFPTWTLCGFPGYNAIDIKTLLGIQVPKIVVYEFLPDSSTLSRKPHLHYVSRKNYLTSMELSFIPEDKIKPKSH
jgi:hypothetical protein